MNLLRDLNTAGYPADYLRARIRGRRACLTSDWESLLAADEPLAAVPTAPQRAGFAALTKETAWLAAQREFAWLYGQMEPGERKLFAPVFGYFELRTLVLCLRNKETGNVGEIGNLLEWSLLPEKLKGILLEETGTAEGMERITAFLAHDVFRQELKRHFCGEGLSGFERGLTDLYLMQSIGGRPNPAVAEFLRALIDTENIMSLCKQLRWRIPAPPWLSRGGRLRESDLMRVASRGEMAGLAPLVRRLTGEELPAFSPEEVEHQLLCWLGRFLRRRCNEPSGVGLILDYLWSVRMEARNLSLLAHGRDMGREMIRAELVI